MFCHACVHDSSLFQSMIAVLACMFGPLVTLTTSMAFINSLSQFILFFHSHFPHFLHKTPKLGFFIISIKIPRKLDEFEKGIENWNYKCMPLFSSIKYYWRFLILTLRYYREGTFTVALIPTPTAIQAHVNNNLT